MHIVHLTYDEIDRKKWDACIRQSLNGLIYAETVYLDHMAVNWDGLVLGDYEAVMPLTWKKKWGIKYLYQPAFFQQGGIFSSKKLNKVSIDGKGASRNHIVFQVIVPGPAAAEFFKCSGREKNLYRLL